MIEYKRLGIKIFKVGETVSEAPFWAKEKEGAKNPLVRYWIESNTAFGYSMPLYPGDAKKLVEDCAHFAKKIGNSLTKDEEISLISYLQDEDDTRIYKHFYKEVKYGNAARTGTRN